MSEPVEKRKRGRPFGSTKKVSLMSKIDSLLKRAQELPERRVRERPRLMSLKAVDLPKVNASESPKNNVAENRDDSRTSSIKISRKEGLVRTLKPPRPVKIPDAAARHQIPIHNFDIKNKNTQVKKKLEVPFGIKRGRGRPRKGDGVVKPVKLASVIVVVGGKRGRGRPRKVQPAQDQIRVNPQDDWVSREDRNKEANTAYWEEKPWAPEWTPEMEECADNMPQWAVGDSALPEAPHSQYPGEFNPEQSNHREDLLKELADFKSQLLSELAATRAEIRAGAQLMNSAISGVSAEIHRLGQILQPLVNVIAAGNASQQGPPASFASRPPQDTPPDDTVNFAHNKTSFSRQDSNSAQPHKLPADSETEEVSLVKIEDAMDSPQPCSHRAQSSDESEVDPPSPRTRLIHHHLNLCQTRSPSVVTPNSSKNVPQSKRNASGILEGDRSSGLSKVSSLLEDPTTRSSQSCPPAISDDCVTVSSESRSFSSVSSSSDNSLPPSSVVASPVGHCPYRPIHHPKACSHLGEAR
ncbi:uncharacterized protein ACMZJ9_013295 isoform 2-T3 [Mantella aurantiaca]